MNDDWIDIKKDPAHIKREREKARQLRKSDWWARQLQQGICHYCGKSFPADELTMDHVLPVVRGGKSVKSNCVPCCKGCNNDKKFLTPAEMILKELDRQDKPDPADQG